MLKSSGKQIIDQRWRGGLIEETHLGSWRLLPLDPEVEDAQQAEQQQFEIGLGRVGRLALMLD